MNTMNRILASFLTASLIMTTASLALAHSGHEEERLPLVWVFNEKVNVKIQNEMNRDIGSGLIGLSHLEQRALDRYGIKVGHSFYTAINNMRALVERTSSGIKILEGMTVVGSEVRWQAPVMEAYRAVPSSLRMDSHHGHHHNHLNLSWMFDEFVTVKIERHLQSGGMPLVVGLSATEQKMAENYGVKVGNSFITTLGGNEYLVKRVSTGMQVVKKISDGGPVALRPVSTPQAEIKG